MTPCREMNDFLFLSVLYDTVLGLCQGVMNIYIGEKTEGWVRFTVGWKGESVGGGSQGGKAVAAAKGCGSKG